MMGIGSPSGFGQKYIPIAGAPGNGAETADAERTKMMRAAPALEVQYDVEQYRKVLGTYGRGTRMPKRRRPVVMRGGCSVAVICIAVPAALRFACIWVDKGTAGWIKALRRWQRDGKTGMRAKNRLEAQKTCVLVVFELFLA
jgi:hypothetical protein